MNDSYKYEIPLKYNEYLIKESEKVRISSDIRNINLINMFESGRYSGEILRSSEEYIDCLRYEAGLIRSAKPEIIVLSYDEFIRDYKINNVIG